MVRNRIGISGKVSKTLFTILSKSFSFKSLLKYRSNYVGKQHCSCEILIWNCGQEYRVDRVGYLESATNYLSTQPHSSASRYF